MRERTGATRGRAVLRVLLFAAACAAAGPAPGATEPAPVRDLFEREWPATSRPYRRVVLSSKIREQVRQVCVEEGTAVRKGDVLVRLDSDVMEARIAAAESAADYAARLDRATATLEHLRREYERLRALGEGISDSRLDQAATTRDLAAHDLDELRRQKDQADRGLALQRKLLRDYEIVAPMDGVVSTLWVQEGELVDEAQRLLELIDPTLIEVHVHVPEQNLPLMERVAEARVAFPAAEGDVARPARVTFVAPYVDSGSGTFLVKLLLPLEERTGPIRPGLLCRVRFIQAPAAEGARPAPQEAPAPARP